MSKLDKLILNEFGVDTAELAERHKDIIGSGVADEHEKTIQAIATAGAVSFSGEDPVGWWGAAMMLFAVGYKAGQDAPDLSIFEGVLDGGE